MQIPPRFENQDDSINFFKTVNRGLDYSDPGTGKSRVQIDLFTSRWREGAMLIIAPKSILDLAWAADVRKFAPNFRTSIAWAHNRAKAFQIDADIFITNTDAAVWLAKQKPAFFERFSTLVIDEISMFKNPQSQRSKAAAKIASYFKYFYGLSGTPDANHILDMWHQAFLVDQGQRLGKSYYAFRSSTCISKQVGPDPRMVKWEPMPGIEEAVASLISDITVRHKFEDCQDIPENFVTEYDITLSPKLRKAYDSMQKTAILEIQSGQYATAVNAASLMTKLMQLASGVVYDEARNSVVVDNDRVNLVCDLIEQRAHSIVFFHWKHQRNAIIEALIKRKITYGLIDGSVSSNQVRESVDRFQKGLYRILLAQPQAAAHGLTLTKGTSSIWMGPTWNLEHYLQGNRRIYRAGQTKRTETVMIKGVDTVDEMVYKKLLDKDKKQMNLLNMLQELSNG